MQIYSLVSQKGGAGKSTLARQLAVLAGESEPSLIVDRDPQRTTTKWWTRREQIEPAFERPELIDLDGTSLTEAAKRLRRKPEGALFIDTRPAVEEPEAEAARVADLVIVPVRPSPCDGLGSTCRSAGSRSRSSILPGEPLPVTVSIRHTDSAGMGFGVSAMLGSIS